LKAVILAAGRGSRLGELTKERPKGLVKLLGLTLLERAILSAKEGGVEDFVIVIGYKGEKIREEIGDGKRYSARIRYVENEEWEKGNGLSLLKARDHLSSESRFIIMMCDHVFDPSAIKKLVNFKEEYPFVLLVDRDLSRDTGEATRVKLSNNLVIDIGKGLKEYQALDCGLMLSTPEIFRAIEESLKVGDDSLSGGIRVLSKKGGVRALEIDGFWMDIDTPENLSEAERTLLNSLTKPEDGIISRSINRRISTRISALILKKWGRVNPNLISAFSFLIAISSSILFAIGSLALGGILAQTSSIIDGCDGEVARLGFRRSKFGAWLDSLLDRIADFSMIFGLSWGYWELAHDQVVWPLCFLSLMGTFLISYTGSKYELDFGELAVFSRVDATRDVRIFLLMIGAILGRPIETLLLLAVITNSMVIRRILITWKRWRESP